MSKHKHKQTTGALAQTHLKPWRPYGVWALGGGFKAQPLGASNIHMGMMKHKHTCLIMAMMSYNNNTDTVLTELPE